MSPRHVLLIALALPLLLTGCADDLTGTTPEVGSKMRHTALLASATRASGVELSAGKSGDGENYVGLIVSLDPYRVIDRYGEMDPYRVIDRYRVISRYRVIDRYEYEHAFAGAAIWVAEDDLDAMVAEMETDDMVTWIEPDVEMSLSPLGLTAQSDGQSETTPWSVMQIGAGTGAAPNVDLYIADTGVSSGDVRERGGRDFSEDADGSMRSKDRDGHGTHIAGIAAAGANGRGIRGIAPGMDVYDLRVLTGKELNDESPVDLSRGIAAVEHAIGAKLANPNRPAVLNFSLGTDVGTTAYNALDDAVDAAVASGVVVVVAAGNSGQDVSTVSPAHARGAITVGAYDQNNRFAAFSNRGVGIDILAPGVDILSTGSDDSGDDLAVMSGTSMAAGHVSGAAALILQANPQATPAQVKAALLASARPLATGVPQGTTNKTLWVGEGGALDVHVPPFFDYAIYSSGKAEIKGRSRVLSANGNASVFAQEVKAEDEESFVRGFAYYTEKMSDDAHLVFRPSVNPTGLAPAQRVAPLAFDAAEVSVARLQSRATRATDGDLELAGHVQLGTINAPVIWYVNGKLKIDAAVQVSGYGVFLVEEDVQITRDIEGLPGSALAIFGAQDIDVDSENVSLRATLFAQGKIAVKDNARIYGSLTSLEEVAVDENMVLRKWPLAPALARALWGN